MPRQYWNANTHYHDLVLAAVPAGATRVLDVGCGDGMLCAEFARAGIPHVVGLDLDAAVLERARARHGGLRIDWLHGDVQSATLSPASFDAVVSIATLHHLDAGQALARFAELVRPGGIVAVLGVAAIDWWDVPFAAFALGARYALSTVHGHWEHSAPQCWPPPLTYSEMKTLSARALPGVRYRRHLLGRYSLVWRKPAQ